MILTKKAYSRILTALAILAVLVALDAAAQSQDILAAGKYTAKVKSIVCEECGPLIKETMEKTKSIDSIFVDSKASTVRFQVKKDKAVKLPDLQNALKSAAAEMGMGADYTLSDVKVVK